eukprot:TRINITY_DN3576_c0_g1_i1.p3 TRINITY_DN3576_c0_g1~~TRINITY_DN3576_c0_g1_i1.p3  ORF type:complete len:85 (-),score=3.85 TRINITY_DN3576_c0_g1_i1:329-583(-)
MVDFKRWVESQQMEFPVPENEFIGLFYSFLQDRTFGAATAQKTLAGFMDGTISYISIVVPVDLYSLASGTQKKPVYNAWGENER